MTYNGKLGMCMLCNLTKVALRWHELEHRLDQLPREEPQILWPKIWVLVGKHIIHECNIPEHRTLLI